MRVGERLDNAAARQRGTQPRRRIAEEPPLASWLTSTCDPPNAVASDARDGRTLHLASLQEPSAFEYRGHRLFDSRRPRHRLLGRGKVVEVTPLPPRRQRLECALETRVPLEPLAQLLGNRKI